MSDIATTSFGDILTFESGTGSFLSVDVYGDVIWLPVAGGDKVPASLSRCTWRLHEGFSYNDQSMLDVRRTNGVIEAELHALQQQAEREKRKNLEREMFPSGNTAVYGAVVQLQHVASGKFLASKFTASREVPDCLNLCLDPGSAAVHFRIVPRYKVRSEGSNIVDKDVVALASCASLGYYLHESTTVSNADSSLSGASVMQTMWENRNEANLSRVFGACGLTVGIYESPCLNDPDMDREYQHIQQALRFFDRETDGFMVASCTHSEHEEVSIKKLNSLDNSPNHPSEFTPGAVWVIEYSQISKRRIGGFVEWNRPMYRIKHVATDRYLTVAACGDMLDASVVSAGKGDRQLIRGLSSLDEELYLGVTLESGQLGDDLLLARQTFSFGVVDSNRDFIPQESAFVSICHSSSDGRLWYLHNRNGSGKFVMSSVGHAYDALLIVSVSSPQAETVRFFRNIQFLLRDYLQRLEKGEVCQRSTRLEIENAAFLRIICECTDSVVTKTANGLVPEVFNTADLVDLMDGAPVSLAQDCARDQFVVDLLLQIVVAPAMLKLGMGFGEVYAPRSVGRSASITRVSFSPSSAHKKVVDWVDSRFKPIAFTHQLAWSALTQLVRKNSTSMMYTALKKIPYVSMLSPQSSTALESEADVLSICIEQVPYPVGAAEFLNTLIDDNRELLTRVVDHHTIMYFKGLIEKFGPQAQFLEFYEAICSCGKEPLPRNQNIVLNELVTGARKRKDNIMLTIYTIPGQVYNSMTVEVDQGEEAFLGEEFFAAGVDSSLRARIGFPRVFVDYPWDDCFNEESDGLYWSPARLGLQMEEIEYIPQSAEENDHPDLAKRTQRYHLPIEELCWILDPEYAYRKVYNASWKNGGSEQYKKRVTTEPDGHLQLAGYFYSLINLLSEMVYGRNYGVIFALEKLYPYVVLVGIARNEKLPYKIRSIFIKFLRRLWVDRYPSESNCGRQSLPDLVWVMSNVPDIGIDDPRSFPNFAISEVSVLRQHPDPFYHISTANKYKLLVEFCKYFLEGIERLVVGNVDENHCLGEVMGLISALTSYGFYSTTSMIVELIDVMLPLLDGRSDVMKQGETEKNYVVKKDLGSSFRSRSTTSVMRYQEDSKSLILTKAKTSIFDALLVIVDLRQQFRLIRLLNVFKNCMDTHSSQVIIDEFPKIFDPYDETVNRLNLDNVCAIPFNASLVDLMMYENDDLFEYALNMLEVEASPVRRLLDVSNKILLLQTDKVAEFDDLRTLGARVSQLRREFESASVWGLMNAGNSEHSLSFDVVWGLLLKLKRFLNPDTLSGEDDSRAMRQELLFDFDVHTILMVPLLWEFQLTELEDYKFEYDEASKILKAKHVATMNVVEVMRSTSTNSTVFKRMNKTLYDIAQASLDILRDIVENFPKLRTEFKVFEQRLVEKVSVFPKQIYPLLAEIYRGTVSQVQNTPPALFTVFGGLLADVNQANNMVSLEFYLSQLKPERDVSESIYRNQTLVAQGLYNSLSSPVSIFKFDAIDGDELFLHHVTAIQVLSECCKANVEIASTVGSAVLSWKSARTRLTGLLEALVAIGTMELPERRTPLYMDRDMETDLPVGMGMGLNCVLGTAHQYICFLQTYIDYVNWTYLSSSAIDVGLVFDDAMINIIVLLCELVQLYYSVSTGADEVDSSNAQFKSDGDANGGKEEAASDMMLLHEAGSRTGVKGEVDRFSIATEARRRDLYTSIMNFFASYVTAVNMTKRQISTVVVDCVYFGCCAMKNQFGSAAVRLCTDMGLPYEHLFREFVLDTGLTRSGDSTINEISSSRKHTRSRSGDSNRRRSVLFKPSNVAITRLPVAMPVLLEPIEKQEPMEMATIPSEHIRDQYYDFMDALCSSRTVSEMVQRDRQQLLNVVMNADKITDPEDPVYCEADEVSAAAESGEPFFLDQVSSARVYPSRSSSHLNTSSGKYSNGRDRTKVRTVHEVRTHKIGWDDIVCRMVRYVQKQIATRGQHRSTPNILNILNLYAVGDDIVWLSKPGNKQDADDFAAEKAAKVKRRQDLLNEWKVTEVCFALISNNVEEAIFQKTLELGTNLLTGRNLECQCEFIRLAYSLDPDGHFFSNLNKTLLECKDWVVETQYDPLGRRKVQIDGEKIRMCVSALLFMQQLCEGHNLQSQEMMREQSSFKRFTVNLVASCNSLVEAIVARADIYSQIPREHQYLLIRILEFLTDAVQGPCSNNQIAIGTYSMLNACKIILEEQAPTTENDDVEKVFDGLYFVKIRCLNLLAALMENRKTEDPVMKIISSKISNVLLNAVYEELHFLFYRNEHLESRKVLSVVELIQIPVKGDDHNCEEEFDDAALETFSVDIYHQIITNSMLTEVICNLISITRKTSKFHSDGGVVDLDKSLPPCHTLFSGKLGRVEIFWNQITQEVVFPVPEMTKFLSETTKNNFIDECELTNSDTRVKDLMSNKDSFVDEMLVLSTFSNFFQFILNNYYMVKRSMFIIIVLLNFNVMLTLTRGTKLLADYYSSGDSAVLMVIGGLMALMGYFSIAVYWSIQVGSFSYRKISRTMNKRMQNGALSSVGLIWESVSDGASKLVIGDHTTMKEEYENMVRSGSSLKNVANTVDLNQLKPVVMVLICYCACCGVHYFALKDSGSSWSNSKFITGYFQWGLAVMIPTLLYCLKSSVVTPTNQFELWLFVITETCSDLNFLGHWSIVALIILALYGYIFLYCLILLDFITMSEHAKNTVRSVMKPWQALVNVAMMFIIVIIIFGIFALVRIGEKNPIMTGEVDPGATDDSVVPCNDAWTCLGVVFYGGLMNSAISSILAATEPGRPDSGDVDFTTRFFFDLGFFIVIGCLLFNMVTGVIVDTFASLREESDDNTKLKTEETFISGIREEMLDGTGVSFDEIQNVDQHVWNYLYYAIYLDLKDKSEFDGIETYVWNCIEAGDMSWLPRRTCVKLEIVNRGKLLDEIGSEIDARQIIAETNSLKRDMSERMQEMENLLTTLMESTDSRRRSENNPGGLATASNRPVRPSTAKIMKKKQ